MALAAGGISAGLLGGLISTPILLTLFVGAFTGGIGIALVAWGTGYVPAAKSAF